MAQKEEYACPEVGSKAVDGIKLEGRKQDDRGAQRGIRQRSEKGRMRMIVAEKCRKGRSVLWGWLASALYRIGLASARDATLKL